MCIRDRKVRIHGRNVLALVDSGSDMSIIPASLINLKSLTESQRALKAVNGSSVRVLGEVNVAFETSGVWFVVYCLVAEHLSEMILGLEWLQKQKAIWNFSEKSLCLQGQVFPLFSLPSSTKCRRIAVSTDVQVPARSEIDTDIYAILPDLKPGAKECAKQPRLLDSGSMTVKEDIVNVTEKTTEPT